MLLKENGMLQHLKMYKLVLLKLELQNIRLTKFPVKR
jgi:hypothetical protein